jgi:hypothetical protein
MEALVRRSARPNSLIQPSEPAIKVPVGGRSITAADPALYR